MVGLIHWCNNSWVSNGFIQHPSKEYVNSLLLHADKVVPTRALDIKYAPVKISLDNARFATSQRYHDDLQK